MRKRTMSAAAAVLAIGIAVSAAAPASAAVSYLGSESCLPSGYVGVYLFASGTMTASATNGILSYGKSWTNVPFWGEPHSASFNTHTATSTVAYTSESFIGGPGKGCYITVRTT